MPKINASDIPIKKVNAIIKTSKLDKAISIQSETKKNDIIYAVNINELQAAINKLETAFSNNCCQSINLNCCQSQCGCQNQCACQSQCARNCNCDCCGSD